MNTPFSCATLIGFYLLLFSCCFARADGSDGIATSLKSDGFRCTDTPDQAGIFCVKQSNRQYVVIPKGVDSFERTVFYAHGLVGVCGNGASGENYLKGESATLRQMKAIAFMPWRQAANNVGYPLASEINKLDKIIGARPLVLAGHSAAGPFFATTLNGTGSAILSRVEKVLLIDAIYGDLTSRLSSVLARNSGIKIKILSNTTAAKSRALHKALSRNYSDRVTLDIVPGNHCGAPAAYFKRINSF